MHLSLGMLAAVDNSEVELVGGGPSKRFMHMHAGGVAECCRFKQHTRGRQCVSTKDVYAGGGLGRARYGVAEHKATGTTHLLLLFRLAQATE